MSLLDPTDTASGPEPTGRRYWRSLEELAETPEFQELLNREFPSQASEMVSPFTRRAFLQLMGASVAFAGALTGCRRPENHILPQSRVPEYTLPGRPEYYATSMEHAGMVLGLWAKSFDGRPIKIEGNPNHPANLGGVDAITQASILELYDPDRATLVLHEGKRSSMEDFQNFLTPRMNAWRARQGEGLFILSEFTTSPSLLALREDLLRGLPRARWHVWEPVNQDGVGQGVAMVFGQPLQPLYHIEKADVILALDDDFLSDGPLCLAGSRNFIGRRKLVEPQDKMNRLYVVEGVYSLTGAKADHRLQIPSSQVEAFALALAAELAALNPAVAPAPLGSALAPYRQHGFDQKLVHALARDLAANSGRALVLAGARQPARLHALAAVLNATLGPECVSYVPPADPRATNLGASIAELCKAMAAGQVETLVMMGGNPAFDAPADIDFAGAMKKVHSSVHLTLYPNETSALATWVVPRLHPLESWGDTRSADGAISPVQPLIEPLYGGLSSLELVAMMGGNAQPKGYELLRAHYRRLISGGEFEAAWAQALHDGLFKTAPVPVFPGAAHPNATAVTAAYAQRPPVKPASSAYELVFLPDPYLWDGRHANNGWLMEAPDPIARISWDNTAMMSPQTAERLGVAPDDLVTINAGNRSIELPVWLVPGLAEGTIGAYLGYGRTVAGRIGRGVGHNIYPLRTASNLGYVTDVRVSKTGRTYPLASVQEHWSMAGRELVREVTLTDLLKNQGQPKPGPGQAVGGQGESTAEGQTDGHLEHPQLFQPYHYTDRPQWGMAIDLTACIGCNACVLACQAENNIPIVGKKQVANGREMHWLRIDRYYRDDPREPGMVFQPIPCMHCETAPCEQVCPVAATTHSPDGLNEMTYNRCIGTRYCSNNCPYKVRRFNFFAYNNDYTDVEKMVKNPEVTVRFRGVMEKCTYCVQRTNRARINAKEENRPVRDGEVTTACAQTCPTQAIVFGDIRDPESRVSRLKAQELNYGLLTEFNTKPRTSYLSQVRNPNPELKS